MFLSTSKLIQISNFKHRTQTSLFKNFRLMKGTSSLFKQSVLKIIYYYFPSHKGVELYPAQVLFRRKAPNIFYLFTFSKNLVNPCPQSISSPPLLENIGKSGSFNILHKAGKFLQGAKKSRNI